MSGRNASLLKDCKITSDSHLQRAIDLTNLIGFPEGVESQKDKLLYITDTLVPFLTKRTIKNSEDLYDFLVCRG